MEKGNRKGITERWVGGEEGLVVEGAGHIHV